MKKLLTVICCVYVSIGWTQTFTEKITREISFDKKSPQNALLISNISGDVKVVGYAGDKVVIEVEKKITAKTEERLELGKQEIQLGIIDRADSLILYVEGAQDRFGKVDNNDRNKWNRRSEWNGWGYIWNNKRGNNFDKKYDYEMNFTIKVPASVHVLAATVNNGDVEIGNVTGQVRAENINGSIRLKEISGKTYASTINGSVDLDYSGNPSENSRYYSLNGNINANFRKGLGAQLAFKSFNGGMYSSIDDITPMAVVVEKYEKGEKGEGIHYRVNGNRFKVRQGGPLLDFETFNGDVYLKEKIN